MAENLNYLAFIVLLIGTLSLLIKLWVKEKWLNYIGLAAAVVSLIALGIVIVLRTIALGHLPFNNVYGFMLCFVWAIVAFYLILAIFLKIPEPGAFVLAVATLLLGVTFFLSDEIQPLMPALRSNWLFLHVFTSVISYSCFALNFGLSLYYLVKIPKGEIAPEHKELSLKLEKYTYNSVIFGFIFLTFLIITGAIWAEKAWGSWWSWDPKETWALVTWLIYACYLHLRRRPKWKGRRIYYIAIIGFICVIFTFLGVTFLMSGLHTYA
ncbi:MAG: c-type cytochrome biogenesis protein CcsB [Bacillota bacterium]|nr:c-type cytochrome biogenesis protein CcsB [Bacillota bacterium]